jgi:hypothetical protein
LTVPDPKNITEMTTLAELHVQLLLAEVIALRIYPPMDSEEPRAASLHHATGFYVGHGPTEAVAIEAAFVELRRALLPEPLKRYLEGES